MFNLVNYSANVLVILTEGGKYFVVLMLSILAIRLWRRWRGMASARRASGLILAGVTTVMAVLISYVSMRQSLARMDSFFGMKAFDDGHLPQALSLFEDSERHWSNADTMARRGVCLLFLGEGDRGLAVLQQARELRKGEGTSFEFMNEGLYRFSQGDAPGAIRFLRAAAKDTTYQWTATKTIAVIELDEGQVAAAAEDMKPFMQVDVTDFDQAYVLASLKLAAGNKAEARGLLDQAPAGNLGPKWQSRFDKLRARLQD
jgi:hypothetical protein